MFVNLLVPTISMHKNVYYYVQKVWLKSCLGCSSFFPKLPPLMYCRVPNSQNKPSSLSVCYEMSPQRLKVLTISAPPFALLAALEFLERYEREGETFLYSIVTVDETWVCHYTPETWVKNKVGFLIS